MKQTKRTFFVLLLCGALLLGAAGCGKAETPEDSSIPVADATGSSSADGTTTTEETTTTTTTETTTAATATTGVTTTTTPTNSAPAASGGDIFINEGEYFVQGGARLVDRTEPIPKEEFLKKYPVSLPGGFSTVTFYYDIPTEDGLRLNKNMSENGFIRCESKDGKSNMYIYVCQTGCIGLSSVWRLDNEPQKSRINNIDIIISRQGRNYKGEFEKDGYYYTFKMYSTEQDDVISALKDLTS